MARRASKLAFLATGVGGAALAGYGFAIGRDFWKATKKNELGLLSFILIFGAITLPVIGTRGLVRGHDRGFLATITLTLIGNTLLIALGLALAFIAFAVITSNQEWQGKELAAAFALATITTAICCVIGLVWGVAARSAEIGLYFGPEPYTGTALSDRRGGC